LDVEVDTARTTLVTSPANVEAAVRSAVATAIINSTLIDAVFLPVTQTACSAQGIAAQGCPNPPSLALTLSIPGAISGTSGAKDGEPDSVLVPVIVGVVVGLIAVSIIAVAFWCRAKSLQKMPVSSSLSGLTIRQVNPGPQVKIHLAGHEKAETDCVTTSSVVK
jgi:hypothetical protein